MESLDINFKKHASDAQLVYNPALVSFRPFLDNLLENMGDGYNKRLQLIATDTWDITDDLQKYVGITSLIQVSY